MMQLCSGVILGLQIRHQEVHLPCQTPALRLIRADRVSALGIQAHHFLAMAPGIGDTQLLSATVSSCGDWGQLQ